MSKPLVLITRPAEDAAETARLIMAMGFDVIWTPALVIEDTHNPDPLPDFTTAGGLIFSSANGVRALTRRNPPSLCFSRTVFAVGDHTARTARDAGFEDVRSAAGTMADLIVLIRQANPPSSLIHFSGADIRDDPARALPLAEGWNIQRVVLYRTVAIDRIPEAALQALEAGRAHAILFYSARSAKSFLATLVKDWPQASCHAARALCLAPPVVDSVQKFNLPWAGVFVSETPDQAGIMALLETLEDDAKR